MTDELTDLVQAVETLDTAISQTSEPITRDDIDVPEFSNEYTAPWDRQPEDASEHAWMMFEHYRDQGPGRVIKQTMRWFNERGGTPSQPSISEVGIYNMATRNNWTDRVAGYDNERERLYQLARSEKVREMVDRHATQVEDAITGLMAPIQALNRRIQEDPEFIDTLSKTNPRDLIKLSNMASRTIPSLMAAERLARDMPTEIVGGTVVHKIEAVERDHIGEILDVLEQAGVLYGSGYGLPVGEVVDAEVVEVHSVPAEGDG